MADNKQYITQNEEQGACMISEDVVGSIVAAAACEVEGVAGLSTKPGADIADLIGKKNWAKGMKITIGEENALTVDCNIIIAYGFNVMQVAQNAQNAIASAVESMVGIKTTAVNINVCGIERK